MIEGRPSALWILKNCLMPELKGISTMNGYMTELHENAVLATFEPDDSVAIRKLIGDSAGLAVWIRRKGVSQTVAGGMLGDSNRHWSMTLYFAGCLKTTGDVQVETMQLVEDHTRVMDNNPSRDQPGGTLQNTWGINTTLTKEYEFFWDMLTEGIGQFDCEWTLDYSTPTTG